MVTIRPRKSLESRFWPKVQKTDGCWLWTGGNKGSSSHGVIQAGGRYGGLLLAHRVSWELHNGPIPEGAVVCHRCDVGACVNPSHLFLGTQAENIQDMDAKGRRRSTGRRGKDHSMVKLSESDVRMIRVLHRKGFAGAQLASAYGVCKNSVYNIINGKTWAHLV